MHRHRQPCADGRQPRTQPLDDHRRSRDQGEDLGVLRRRRSAVPGGEHRGAQRRSQRQGDRLGDVPGRASPRGAGAGPGDASRSGARRLVDRCLRGLLRLGAARRLEFPARRPLAGDRVGVDDVPPRTRGRGRRAARHPADGHPGVPPRGRLLHRRFVQPGPATSGQRRSPTSTVGSSPSSDHRTIHDQRRGRDRLPPVRAGDGSA